MAEAGNDDNTIFIGKKPAMSYVMAVVTQFSSGADDVFIKARGRSISRAVDVAEVARNRFYNDFGVDIAIGTEAVKDDSGSDLNISTISIRLTKA